MVELLLSAAMYVPEVVVSSRHPRTVAQRSEELTARCGSSTLAIVNIGTALPKGSRPAIRFNGRDVSKRLPGLVAFLAEPRAAYRFSTGCFADQGRFVLGAYRAEPEGNTIRVAIHSASLGSGNVREGETESGPEVTAESFWFR